jgi:glycosyltransferase involved in cell wall biosynthesis
MLLVVTSIPAPYQVELFDALAARHGDRLRVVYLKRTNRARHWSDGLKAHRHVVLDEVSGEKLARQWADDAELVVFSNYQTRYCQDVMRRRSRDARPWCFWGERPGAAQMGVLGVWHRRLMLAALHRSSAPIWGIGNWAVEGYRREFGIQRSYFNVPYFSNLQRFVRPTRAAEAVQSGDVHFLFSGALIPRKGVDLLSKSFARLAGKFPRVQLTFVGTGKLRPGLEEQLARWNDRVRFVGFFDWDQLPEAYWQADILCAPSRYDGWGMVVPEGLSAGLPVIATDRTGAALDLIAPGENGWIVQAGGEQPLYDAMQEAASLSTEEWKQRREAAVSAIASHSLEHGVHVFESAVERTIDLWRQLGNAGLAGNSSPGVPVGDDG